MAWVEQVGQRSWRVRYRTGGGCASVSGFTIRTAALDYTLQLYTDQRRGTWLDPARAKTRLAAWVARWIDTIDVETRTEETTDGAYDCTSCPAGVTSDWATSAPRT